VTIQQKLTFNDLVKSIQSQLNQGLDKKLSSKSLDSFLS